MAADYNPPMDREEALKLIAMTAQARYERVNVPLAIREALKNAPRGPAHDRILEAIGVLTDCPYNEMQRVSP